MYLDNPKLQKEKAESTKKKWEALVFGDKPYPCTKCGIAKHPSEFVIHRMNNYRVGKYRYLYECKECKKNRIYSKRNQSRETIEGAIEIIIKQLEQGAKKRKISFNINGNDLLTLWNKQQGKCYYSGYPMEYEFIHYKPGKESDKTKRQISCDRLDNDRGYEKGNIVLCCTIINKMKNNLPQEEFFKICKDVSKYGK
ncbi:MAG: hypothetical protein PHR61_02890 [Candidatus Absconditabacteria bacterium]|nr:hypothetical protein [Candidatus Absconditabacteria bacterium]